MRRLVYILSIALCLLASPALAALSIDGTAQSAKITRATSGTLTLTWTGTNDEICIYYGGSNPVTNVTVTSVTGGGLTFAHLTQPTNAAFQNFTDNPGNKVDQELFCAAATAAQTATTFTVNLSGVGPDSSVIFGWAINGQNTTTPVDVNASLAQLATNISGVNTTVQVTGVSTTNANTILLGFYVSSGDQAQTFGTGYTLLTGACLDNSSGLTVDTTGCVEYQIVSSTQSGISPAFGNVAQGWGMVVTAIQQASGGATCPLTRLMMGVGC
jgi:hypothetical protein